MALSSNRLSSSDRALSRVRSLEQRIRAFEALPEHEQMVLCVLALFPDAVWHHRLIQACQPIAQRLRARPIDSARLRRMGRRWHAAGLAYYDDTNARCDGDLAAYLVRTVAETPFGAQIRESVGGGAFWDPGLWCKASDSLAYRARLMRLSGKAEVSECLRQFFAVGKDVEIATLFGPGDPWFVPMHLPDWRRLLPRAIGFDLRRLGDSAWDVELLDALTKPDPQSGARLLLPEDATRWEELRQLAADRDLGHSEDYLHLWYTWQIFQGNEDCVRERTRAHVASGIPLTNAYLGTVELSRGNLATGLEAFERCRDATDQPEAPHQTIWVGGVRLLALLARQTPNDLGLVSEKLRSLGRITRRNCEEPEAFVQLGNYLAALNGNESALEQKAQAFAESPISLLVTLIVLAWSRLDRAGIKEWVSLGIELRNAADLLSHHWIVRQLDAVIERLQTSDPARAGTAVPSAKALVDLITEKAPWEATLESLARIADKTNQSGKDAASKQESESRIAWLIEIDGNELRAEPRLQTRKGNQFTRGRTIALERLVAPVDASLPVSNADLAVVSHIGQSFAYHGSSSYWLKPTACLGLIDHPYVFDVEDASIHYEVKQGQLRLRCALESDGSHRLTLEPTVDPNHEGPFVVRQDHRITVYDYQHEIQKVSKLVGKELRLPAEASTRLQEILPRLSALLPTSANFELDRADVSTGDSMPVLRIHPHGATLRVEILVTPIGVDGPAFRPGAGDESLSYFREGESHHVHRDLRMELERAQTVIDALQSLRESATRFEWAATELVECLDFLSELSKLDHSLLRVEWPDGEPLRLRHMRDMKLAIRGRDSNRWFEVDASIRLSDDAELRIAELINKLRYARGRFIELSSRDYAELSQSAIDRLRLLEAFRLHGAKEPETMRVAPWLALALPESAQGDLTEVSDELWSAWRKRVVAASTQKAVVSKHFAGTLRDYQIAGFEWLSRMAALGTGVCLADDMGLGKTVQALALLQQRATRRLAPTEVGKPSLIVAPASVCPGWIAEAARFTPNLQMRWLTGADRSLSDLTRTSIVVCTYDILYRDRETLCAILWDTVVLDEAHQIKNAHTQRARAAFSLRAEFRLATTGTPIENHLGELWSLYRFLMPGLLGEQHEFVERFRSPIENQHDVERRIQLQSLVRPFLLRRTKQQVLTELPARTELIREVQLSAAEIELYEAVRQRGLLALSHAPQDPNQQRVRVLAELMRLRRVCCHPRLVIEDSEIPSSKLAALLELIEELRESGHRALLFSQFVDHLTLVREALDDQGISYQYLDGSTPVTERAKRVAAFQAGHGELFLISLRAGGTGLNLTAADYVIHLDPWWNPAVEDQASDRAHRIGQERPVTIYRLVTRGTIEQRLVSLHLEKRALASDILQAAEGSKRLDPDELLSLLRSASVSLSNGVIGAPTARSASLSSR